MAGVNQHYIPQSLLRGFRVPGGSSARSRTWLVRKSQEPSVEIIKESVAVEEYFYSPLSVDGFATLDDQITSYENQFSRLLQSLKDTPFGSGVEPAVAAEVIAHLTIRNAHLRLTFTGAVRELMTRMGDVFASEDALRGLLGLDGTTPSERVTEAVDKEIANDATFANSGLPPTVMHKIAHMLFQERFSRAHAQTLPGMLAALRFAEMNAPASIRDGHNKTLADTSVVDKRKELLASLKWSVQAAPDEGFILPDCVAIGQDDGSGFKPLVITDLNHATQVFMPLSSKKMLVGQRGDAPILIEAFNAAAASCSHAFFIAGSEKVGLEELSALIGKASDTTILEAVDTALDQYLRKLEPDDAVDGNDDIQSSREAETKLSPVSEFVVSLKGFPDEAIARTIGNKTVDVVHSLSSVLRFGRLDGITLAFDLPAAVAALDFGYEAPPLQLNNVEPGTGYAVAPTVVRNGVSKVHILMEGHLGYALIDENEDIVRVALYWLVYYLAHASNHQVMDEALSGGVLRRLDDIYESAFFPTAEQGWYCYYASRISARTNPAEGQRYTSQLIELLGLAKEHIPQALFAYQADQNMDVLVGRVLPYVANILALSAQVVGHNDALEIRVDSDRALMPALEEAGLHDWIVLFQAELRDLWNRQGQWTSFDEFLAMIRHVERLFWASGMVPWKDGGQIRFIVGVPPDALRLKESVD